MPKHKHHDQQLEKVSNENITSLSSSTTLPSQEEPLNPINQKAKILQTLAAKPKVLAACQCRQHGLKVFIFPVQTQKVHLSHNFCHNNPNHHPVTRGLKRSQPPWSSWKKKHQNSTSNPKSAFPKLFYGGSFREANFVMCSWYQQLTREINKIIFCRVKRAGILHGKVMICHFAVLILVYGPTVLKGS